MEFLPVASDHEALDYRQPRRQTAAMVVASPHSGSVYPAAFLAQTAVPLAALRRAEDAFVDELFSAAPSLGIPLLAAFDRARPIGIGSDKDGRVLEWDPAFAYAALQIGLVSRCVPGAAPIAAPGPTSATG